MTFGRVLGAASVLAAGAMLVAGCSTPASPPSGASTATPRASASAVAPAASIVGVVLKEFSVTPSTATARPGSVTFRAQNSGALAHELLVVRSDQPSTQLPLLDGKDLDPAKVQIVAQTPPFDGGQSREVTVTLAAGKYVLLCNVSGHYLTGMAVAFTVQ